ncbi:MAG: 4-(cytidine 5'-diphospho)-2-C-methyl-D-erythritol kinase [candidate division Zixibacteria bacterium]|jgi:4-diphosphocytidyl-2-C-methyl-D-erythritol kinase|nr:4-(cytidine 5'-diphospho)-2-C-methyl-D-erythritol kinase [candidate division Zixibacteria bacterium]
MFCTKISEDELVVGAPAKINLFLQVLNRRDDGYHNINSVFQAVSLFDRLRVRRDRSGPFFSLRLDERSSVASDLDCGPANLVARAFELMKRRFDLTQGLAITLEKQIPVAAGLAGGSTDAAACIYAVNRLFELGLSRREMAAIGSELGSDIPFFFSSGQALVTGRGEQVDEIVLPLDYWVVLVTPRVGVSTAEAYRALRMTLTNPKNPFTLPRCETVGELVGALRLTTNDFEEGLLLSSEGHQRIKESLLECGAELVRLSGSGPTVFGVFSSPPPPEECIGNAGAWQVSTVRPIALPSADSF